MCINFMAIHSISVKIYFGSDESGGPTKQLTDRPTLLSLELLAWLENGFYMLLKNDDEMQIKCLIIVIMKHFFRCSRH